MSTKITLRPEGATDSSQDVVLADGADRSADNVRGPAAGTINVAIGVQRAVVGEDAMADGDAGVAQALGEQLDGDAGQW